MLKRGGTPGKTTIGSLEAKGKRMGDVIYDPNSAAGAKRFSSLRHRNPGLFPRRLQKGNRKVLRTVIKKRRVFMELSLFTFFECESR